MMVRSKTMVPQSGGRRLPVGLKMNLWGFGCYPCRLLNSFTFYLSLVLLEVSFVKGSLYSLLLPSACWVFLNVDLNES